MTRSALSLFVGVTLLSGVVLSRPSLAQQTDDSIRVARSIERLGSPSFDERAAARVEILAGGRSSRALLEAAAQSAKTEVRLQAADLLKTLKIQALWEAEAYTFQAQNEAASQALDRLCALSGNQVVHGDQLGSFQDVPVTLSGKLTFWQALDELCRQSGNNVRANFDTAAPGLVISIGGPGKFPIAYSGPVRAQITSARRVFMEDFDYETLRGDTTHTFQLNLEMMWEDRFRLVAYRSPPEVVEIRAGGRTHPAASQPAGSGWNVAGGANRKLSLDLRLHPPATVSGKIDSLKLSWDVIAVGDMAAIDVPEVTKPGVYRQDDIELRVESIQPKSNGRWEATVSVIRALVIPDPPDVLLQENRLEMYDQEGRPYRVHGQINSLVEGAAKITVTFGPPEEESTPQFLRLVYPRIRAQNSLAIVFTDIPLPSSKPE